ncbi:MAG: FG-GAP repeat protein [Phycisphaerae bacterium]|nr:FG-GAP repeat protein [Phycisphaerae bacterium]
MLSFHGRRTRCGALVIALAANGLAAADTIELKSTNPISFGQFGIAVAGIPDIDGDTFGDMVVGAWSETASGQAEAGRAYVFSGRTGALIRSHFSPNAEFDGGFGWAVAGIGDVTGDGRGDYIIGAYQENGSGINDSGRVYVYSGATGNLVRTHTMPSAESFGRFGYSVSSAPDLTGDGKQDYVIGATGAGTSGKVYVYNGTSGALVRTTSAPGSAAGGNFGHAVAGVPDADGDGTGDYAVGAPYASPGSSPLDAGRAYLFSGATGFVIHEFASPNETASGQFGYSVAGVADTGGNGLGDVVVAGWLETAEGFSDSGNVYIFSGTFGGLNLSFPSPNAESNGNFGMSVFGVGDRNGDGYEDILVGAPGETPTATLEGRAYVIDGNTGVTLETINSFYNGTSRGFAEAVTSVPDVNGDGRRDILIGSTEDEGANGLPNEGRAYLYRDLENDGCGLLFSAIPELVNGYNYFTNIGAEGGGSGLGCTGDTFTGDIWFSYTATCNGPVTFSTCEFTNFDTKLAVYAGCGFTQPFFLCNLNTLLGCDDDGCGIFAGGSNVTLDAAIGECFWVRVGGYNGDDGLGYLKVSCTPACPGDLDGNGVVDGADLGQLLGAWGSATVGPDINSDGTVNGQDLGILLGNWGGC